MSENTYKPTEAELLAAASNAKSNVAASLKKAMGAMSQRGLGLAAGVDQKTIGRTLNQKNAIGVDNLARIALVLGLKPWDMLRPADQANDAMTMSQLDGFEGQLVTLFRKLSPDDKHDALVELNKRVDKARPERAFFRPRQTCLSESVGDRNLFCNAEAFLP